MWSRKVKSLLFFFFFKQNGKDNKWIFLLRDDDMQSNDEDSEFDESLSNKQKPHFEIWKCSV